MWDREEATERKTIERERMWRKREKEREGERRREREGEREKERKKEREGERERRREREVFTKACQPCHVPTSGGGVCVGKVNCYFHATLGHLGRPPLPDGKPLTVRSQ